MKRLQLVRKKLLPLLLCVAVAGSQVPVMAADVEGFSDSAEGFNEEWSEDTQTQSAEAEDTTETAEGNTAENITGNTTENTGIPDEQTEDIAEVADGDTEDIALQSSEEDTETPETSEGLSSDSQEDTFGDGEESFGDASDSDESGIEYIKGRPLTEEEEQEQLAPFDNLTSYSTAVEIALGAAIQNIVAQDEGAAKRAIALLKERGAGRATFLPLTNIKANPVRECGPGQRAGAVR